jgi:protein tyrosine phosphatase
LPEDKELFISTQGPLHTTIETFWKIIIKKNIKLVIMLSNLEEQGRKKCDKYWPDRLDTSIIFEKFQIELENQDFIVEDSVLQRCLIVHDEEKGTKYSITQLHVVCWPDHNAPEKEIGFKMIELLISFVDNYRICYKNSPILVHCR